MIIYDNNVFAMMERPIAAAFFALTAISLIYPIISGLRGRGSKRLIATAEGE